MGEIESKLPEFKAIGMVKNDFKDPTLPEKIASKASKINIFPQFLAGLSGIKEGDIIIVIYVFHKSKGYKLMVHPRGDSKRPKKGVFLTCSPYRPNPVGISLAKVIKIQNSEIEVIGLDAIDGSPIIDVKPALPILNFFKEMTEK